MGKKYCAECSRCCKQECKTCHKLYPSLKYFQLGADRCKSCSTRHEKRKMFTKNETIALTKVTKGKNKPPSNERGEESDDFSPLGKLKLQNRKHQRSVIGDNCDPDCRSSSCSPLTISDNESVDEASADEAQTKMDKDSDLEGAVIAPKKNRKTEPSTSFKNRSVYDMLKNAADKKKEDQGKKIQNPFNRRRGPTRRNR